jgi:hypothetical protein
MSPQEPPQPIGVDDQHARPRAAGEVVVKDYACGPIEPDVSDQLPLDDADRLDQGRGGLDGLDGADDDGDDVVAETPAVIGAGQHVVLGPARNRHMRVRTGDVEFLLMDTLVSIRMGKRLIVFEPISPPDKCHACKEAYAEARARIEQAGGIAKWMERFMQPEWGSKADRGEVEA